MSSPHVWLHKLPNEWIWEFMFKMQRERGSHSVVIRRPQEDYGVNARNWEIYQKCKFWFRDFEDAEIFYFAYTPITNVDEFYHFIITYGPHRKCKYDEELTSEQIDKLYTNFKEASFKPTGNEYFSAYTQDVISWALQQKDTPKKKLNRLMEIKQNILSPIFSDSTSVDYSNISIAAEGLERVDFILWDDFLNIFVLTPENESHLIQAVNDKVIYGEPKFFLNYKTAIQWLIKEGLLPFEYTGIFNDEIKLCVTRLVEQKQSPEWINMSTLLNKLKRYEKYVDYDEYQILKDAQTHGFGVYLKVIDEEVLKYSNTRAVPDSIYETRYNGYERLFSEIHDSPHPINQTLSVKGFIDAEDGKIKISPEQFCPTSCAFQITELERKYGIFGRSLKAPRQEKIFDLNKLIFFIEEIKDVYIFNEQKSSVVDEASLSQNKADFPKQEIIETTPQQEVHVDKAPEKRLLQEYSILRQDIQELELKFNTKVKGKKKMSKGIFVRSLAEKVVEFIQRYDGNVSKIHMPSTKPGFWNFCRQITSIKLPAIKTCNDYVHGYDVCEFDHGVPPENISCYWESIIEKTNKL